jgi:hypothetical protein
MRNIIVVKLLETPCLLALEKGKLLEGEIRKALASAKSVSVDFTDYEFLSSAFLNHAFGQLCIDLDWDVDMFRHKVRIVGLDEDDAGELALAIDNAQTRRSLIKRGINPKEYYASLIPA